MMTQLQNKTPLRYSYRQPMSVIALASGKGGVGKTSISVNLAVALAELGNSVMLLDADMGLGNVDIALGIKPEFTLDEVMQGSKNLEDILLKGPGGIHIVPAGSGIARMANLSSGQQVQLIRDFSDIDMEFDHMLVDIGAGINSSVINFSGACQELVVVVCDEPTSIIDAYALIKVLRQKRGIKRFKILANQITDDAHGRRLYLKLAELSGRFLDTELNYFGAIPADGYLKKSVKQQSAAIQLYPRSEFSKAVKKLATLLHKRPAADVTSSGLGFFFERLITSEQVMDDVSSTGLSTVGVAQETKVKALMVKE